MLWWTAPLRRTAMGGTIGWRAIRRRPCPRLGFAGSRLRFHWLWPCGLCVCRRGVFRFGTCGTLFRMSCRLLGTRGVAFARLCLRPRSWLWGRRSMVFGWSCCWFCGFGSIFRLRLCAFGRPGLPVVLRFRMILCMQRGWQRRGETTEEKPVKQPGRKPCFHCHDSLSVWKNIQPMRGREGLGIKAVWIGCSILAGDDWGLCRVGKIR
jgi:hypothetical protein